MCCLTFVLDVGAVQAGHSASVIVSFPVPLEKRMLLPADADF